jgi:phosphatidylglycerol:prolipoprotein diacylglycerol transferase
VWEGQMDVIIFALLLILMQRKLRRGSLFLTYNILYNAGRFCLEMLRGDSPRYLFHWTAAQWTSVCAILLSVVLYLYLAYVDKKQEKASANK